MSTDTAIAKPCESLESKPPKEMALEVIRSLPATASWERIQYELYVCQQFLIGLDQLQAGEGIPDEVLDLNDES